MTPMAHDANPADIVGVVRYRPEPWWWTVVDWSLVALTGAFLGGTLLRPGPDWRAVAGAVVLAPWFVLLALNSSRRVTITANAREGWLRVELRRWPRSPDARVFRLSEVTGAEVMVDAMAEGGQRRVALVLASGERVPLVPDHCSGRRHHERAAEALRALVAADRSAPAQPPSPP